MVCRFCALTLFAFVTTHRIAVGKLCSVGLIFALIAVPLRAGESADLPYGNWFDNLAMLTAQEYSLGYAALGGAGTSYDNGELFAALHNPAHAGMSGLNGGRLDFAQLSPQTWRSDFEPTRRSGAGGRLSFAAVLADVNLGFGLVYSELDTDPVEQPSDLFWNGITFPNLTTETVRSLTLGVAAEHYIRAAVGVSFRHVTTLRPMFLQLPDFLIARGTIRDIGFTVGLDSRDLQRRLAGRQWAVFGIAPRLELGVGAAWTNQGQVKVPAMGIAVFAPRTFAAGAHAGLSFSVEMGGNELELFRAVISSAALDDRRDFDWLTGDLSYRDACARLQFWNDVALGELHPGIEQRRGASFEFLETFTFGSGKVRPAISSENFWTDNRQHAWSLRSDGLFKLGATLWENSVTRFCARHLTVSWSETTIGELIFVREAIDLKREHHGFSIGLRNLTL